MKIREFTSAHKADVMQRMRDTKRPYHGPDHVEQVIGAVKVIGRACALTEEEIDLIELAALYHDLGFEVSPRDHEENSVRLFGVDAIGSLGVPEIEAVSSIIMATKMPHDPRTIYQKVMADADLSYIVLDDYEAWAEKLRIELGKNHGWDWTELQSRFLYTHKYHTKFMQEQPVTISMVRDRLLNKITN